MKFNYKLQRLCGASYGIPNATSASSSPNASGVGGNILFDSTGNTLLSPVSNRIQMIDLIAHTVRTFPISARSNLRTLALSPKADDNRLLIMVDCDDYCTIANYKRGIALHRIRFKKKVRCASFGPDGAYLAVTYGRAVRVWKTPGGGGQGGGERRFRREAAPLELHRTYPALGGDVLHIDWSSDGTVLLGTGRDGTAKIWTLHTVKDYVPVTLSGHRNAVVGGWFERPTGIAAGAAATDKSNRLRHICTVSADGAVVRWVCRYADEDGHGKSDTKPGGDVATLADAAVDFFAGSGGNVADSAIKSASASSSSYLHSTAANLEARKTQAHHLVGATWSVASRHYFHPSAERNSANNDGASSPSPSSSSPHLHHHATAVTSCAYDARSSLLVVGFSTGLFGLYELPSLSNIHTLSVSNRLIRTVAINNTAEWLAFGCPSAQQLLVWEWRSEQHVLKQRGHAFGMRCAAYSPDGAVVATGGEDGTLKLWNTTSGFCYCTLSHHTAAITDVAFANSSVVLTSSLDGSVRAHDLHRYRNFRTCTSTPTSAQFVSVACDPAGEIVAGGTVDPFHVYVWELRTGSVLEVLTGHSGPVIGLAFHPRRGTLASGSWDGTVKIWDLYKKGGAGMGVGSELGGVRLGGAMKGLLGGGKGGRGVEGVETLTHGTDVTCLAFRPDGERICSGTVGGFLRFWRVEDGALVGEIDGRRDIAGGRKVNDRRTADNNASSRYFTSVCYSADGTCVLAGGNSKYVCIYEVEQGVLLKKFQISYNRSLDGVLDKLNSKDLGEAGPIHDRAGSDDDDEADYSHVRHIPGARRGDDGSRKSRVEVLTSRVAFSPTGREWSAVSGEGLHVYSLDDDLVFDPISLTECITPSSVHSALTSKRWGDALRMSMHLNESEIIRHVVECTPHESIPSSVSVVRSKEHLVRMMQFVSTAMADSPHLEFYLRWCMELLRVHGTQMERHRGSFLRAFRAMHRSILIRYDEVKKVCDENRYALDFVEDQARLNLSKTSLMVNGREE